MVQWRKLKRVLEGLPWWVARKRLSEEEVGQDWGPCVGPEGRNWVVFGLIGDDGDCHFVPASPEWFLIHRDLLFPAAFAVEGFDHGLSEGHGELRRWRLWSRLGALSILLCF